MSNYLIHYGIKGMRWGKHKKIKYEFDKYGNIVAKPVKPENNKPTVLEKLRAQGVAKRTRQAEEAESARRNLADMKRHSDVSNYYSANKDKYAQQRADINNKKAAEAQHREIATKLAEKKEADRKAEYDKAMKENLINSYEKGLTKKAQSVVASSSSTKVSSIKPNSVVKSFVDKVISKFKK